MMMLVEGRHPESRRAKADLVLLQSNDAISFGDCEDGSQLAAEKGERRAREDQAPGAINYLSRDLQRLVKHAG